ncbi:MAG: PGF-pre-PGF domain-containing protein [Methanolobus sp.]|uniref:PGF-pre-PGF domain-containing protein n=1 Tax=Methanolobus sp. TaxID=1874737 RepID=UPI0027321013|nr:PGF-pre-PGF domain-containing protein [Methanolobus sp.]MDP2215757.1 PGF-pre-PGF domain-containing protein [Methanolobus sp.]
MPRIDNHPYSGRIPGKVSLVFALALIALISLTFVMPASAQAIVTIYPSTQNVYANSTFSIYVGIEPITPFVGAQLDILFDKDFIIANKVEEGSLFGRDSIPHLFNKGLIDNAAGSVTGSYAVALGGSSISIPGTFIQVECTALGKEGYCSLDLINVILSDSQGRSVPVTVNSGGVLVLGETGDQSDTIGNSSGGDTGFGNGGGGGGSGTSEDAENIYIREVKSINILSNTNVTYQFSEQENPVQYIAYHSLKSAGQITSSIEVLKNVSVTATNVPPGTVYKHVNIWVGKHGYATEENIKGAVIGFKVPKEWMKINGFDASSIRIYRFNNGEWRELQTNTAGEDQEFVFFQAETPGFSPFAITAFAMATSSMENNYQVFMDMKTGTYEKTADPGLQNEASATEQDSDNEQTLGQNSALFLILILMAATIRRKD